VLHCVPRPRLCCPAHVTERCRASAALRARLRESRGTPTHFYVSSGAVNTSRSREQRYGRWEARVKLPLVSASVGYTLHSSIWLFSDVSNPNRSGCAQEIDIVEQYVAGGGPLYAPSRVTANLHPFHGGRHAPGGCTKAPYTRPRRTSAVGDWTSNWTTFAVDWTAGRVVMRVDGSPFAVFDQSPDALASFTDPLFVALTACVMDRLPPTHLDTFPLEYLVDWVKVYDWVEPPSTPAARHLAPPPSPTPTPTPTRSASATAPPPPKHLPSTPTTEIHVSSAARMGDPIPPNFVGLSMEVAAVLSMLGAHGNRSALAQALRNLAALTPYPHAGPVLRLGGNSADESCWGDAQPHGCTHRITAAELGM
jgi:hypothetical protein